MLLYTLYVYSIDNEHIHSDLFGEIKEVMSEKEATQIVGNLEVEQPPAVESDTLRADLENFPSQHIAVKETDIDNEPAVSSCLDITDVSQSQTGPPILQDQAQNFSSVSTGIVNMYLLYSSYNAIAIVTVVII